MSTLLILKARAGDLFGQEFSLPGPAHCVLGRSRTCTLRLPGDASVSRQHCLIEVEDGRAWVQDLGSLNGTQVNGVKIGQREARANPDATMVQPPRQGLQTGDELRLGAHVFEVELAGAPERRRKDWSDHGSHTFAACV
jgi:pSer/pThr/pTyr-binding forkhead associated (FHA) protein